MWSRLGKPLRLDRISGYRALFCEFFLAEGHRRGEMPMVEPRMGLTAFDGKLLEARGGSTSLEGLWMLSLELMESEVAALIGAER